MRTRLGAWFAIPLAAMGGVSACGSDSTAPPDAEVVQSISIAPVVDTVVVGATIELEASLLCQHGQPIDRPVTWQSAEPAIAIVSPAGIVTGVSRGLATITATSDGKTANAGINVLAVVNGVTVEPAVAELDVGATLQLAAQLRDAEGNALDRPMTWASSNLAIATVSEAGLVSAVAAGEATISATSEDKVGTMTVTVLEPVSDVVVSPAAATLDVGQTLALAATPRDEHGNALSRPVEWSSDNTAAATVDAAGVVTAVGTGSATISAGSHGKSGQAVITVQAPVATIVISDPGQEPIAPGATLQLTATPYDAGGAVLPGRAVHWSSSESAVATVDGSGLVTGVARGTAVITASSGPASASVSVRVAGETSMLGNNLSWPVVFAEGIGITGLAVSTDAGLRPTTAEGIAVDQLPFWNAANTPDYGGTYYMQQGSNVWQAAWLDGSAAGMQQAEAAWGDNLTSVSFNTHQNIRIEVVLSSTTAAPLTGYAMTHLYGSGPDEMQGTDGSTADLVPTVYSVMPRLIIEKLDDSRQPVLTVFDGAVHEGVGGDGPGSFSPEVNVAGKLVYGYNLMIQQLTFPADIHKFGWYRITFQLDEAGTVNGTPVARNTAIVSLAANEGGVAVPQLDAGNNRTWIEINVQSASGGAH